MFEKEITSGNHVSYHFCVDKFADNFHPKSRQHDIEKQLRYVDIDLSPYELGITSSNTTSDGDYVHVSYLRRLNNGFMRQEVLDYFNITADFPVLYFTRKVPFESGYKCGFYLGAFQKFNSVFFDDTVSVIQRFKDKFKDVFLAGDFTKDGKFIDDSINIEIFPFQTNFNYLDIREILINEFGVVEEKISLYDNMMKSFNPSLFHFHFKIKLYKDRDPIVKFYRTYPHNPFQLRYLP